MNAKIFILFLAAIIISGTNLHAQKKGTDEKISLEIIHNTKIHDELAKIQTQENSDERFFLFPLVDLAYNMLVGKAIDGTQNKVKNQLDKSKQKYASEWTASVSKDYFYSKISSTGHLDPSGMQFEGIKATRLINKVDTALYFSCYIDTASFRDIIKNSRFTLALDTLKIDLSKTRAKLPKNKTFNLDVEVKILASWINHIAQYFKDQEMGSFNMTLSNIKYNPKDPIHIYTGNDEKSKLKGSCFMIPRSCIGYVDNKGAYENRWGQGEYAIVITVKEKTDYKNIAKDFFDEYVIKVTDKYGTEVKSSYGSIESW